MPILKITIGAVFGLAVIAYVNDPGQAKQLASIIVEMLFSIGASVRHAGAAIFNLI